MKFAGEIAAFVVLQRDDLAQQAAIVLAQAVQRAGEFVGFFGALCVSPAAPMPADQVLVVARPHPGQAFAQFRRGRARLPAVK